MIEFGKTLRDAREAKGLSVAQLADMTHMTVNTINELENEDFTRIPAPIYGRGFVKLYCETVGLDPKPLLAEFMDILNGNRDDCIRERPTADTAPVAPEEPVDVPQEEPAATDDPDPSVDTTAEIEDVSHSADDEQPASESVSPAIPKQDAPTIPEQDAQEPPEALPELPPRAPIISQQDFFQDTPLQGPVASVPLNTATPLSRPVVPTSLPTTPQQPAAATSEPQISRYAAPLEQTRAYATPAYGRIALLVAAAAIAIFIVLLGLRSLYRATATTPAPPPAEPAVETTVNQETTTLKEAPAAKEVQPAAKKTQPAAEKAKVARTPQRIPSLYID